jgi:hypothetical protein
MRYKKTASSRYKISRFRLEFHSPLALWRELFTALNLSLQNRDHTTGLTEYKLINHDPRAHFQGSSLSFQILQVLP